MQVVNELATILESFCEENHFQAANELEMILERRWYNSLEGFHFQVANEIETSLK